MGRLRWLRVESRSVGCAARERSRWLRTCYEMLLFPRFLLDCCWCRLDLEEAQLLVMMVVRRKKKKKKLRVIRRWPLATSTPHPRT